MLNLFDKTRCKRCHNERQVRKCPRLDKNLCWECCNSLRYDLSCPTSCPYSGKQEDSAKAPFPAFKADSQTESRNVNSLYIDIWMDKKQDALGGISPRLAATEDKKKLLDWLSSYQYPPQFPIDYLMLLPSIGSNYLPTVSIPILLPAVANARSSFYLPSLF